MKKLKSRKLWIAVIGIITGIAIAFGIDEGAWSTISGAIVSLTSAVGYMISEAKVDAASLNTATESAKTLVNTAKEIINE